MTTITLPPEIEEPLAEEARRQGTPPELLALDSLRARFAPPTTPAPEGETLFDFLQGFVGTVEGASKPLSDDTGRRFTKAQQARMQELLARRAALAPEERAELEELVDAELDGTVARTDRLAAQL